MKFRQPKKGYAVLRERMEKSGALPSIGRGAAPPAKPEPTHSPAVEPDAMPESSEGTPVREPSTPREEDPVSAAPNSRPRTLETSPRRENPNSEADRIVIKLPAPVPGVYPYYDRAAATVGHRMAMLSLIARAFDMLEADLKAGKRITVAQYRGAGKLHRASTSRMVPRSLLTQARECIDPMGILAPAAFTRLLTATALARYLDQQSVPS